MSYEAKALLLWFAFLAVAAWLEYRWMVGKGFRP